MSRTIKITVTDDETDLSISSTTNTSLIDDMKHLHGLDAITLLVQTLNDQIDNKIAEDKSK